MEELFIVIELQKNGDQLSHLITDYQEGSQAQFQFYYASAYAATSTVESHTVLLVSSNGNLLNMTNFYHENAEIESENISPPQLLVIEYQIDDTQASKLVTIHDNLQEANNKFNTVAASASISNVKKHLIMMFDANGTPIKNIVFEH